MSCLRVEWRSAPQGISSVCVHMTRVILSSSLHTHTQRPMNKHSKESCDLNTIDLDICTHMQLLPLLHYTYMAQQLGSEVERQGKANRSTTPRTALSFQRKEEELSWV